METFFADLNPGYPSKGERRYCVYRRTNGELFKLPKQFNSLKRAEQFAYTLEVRNERRRLAVPYLGD